MDWSNERYVRLFTRDTPEWLWLPWQARASWPLIIRKLDRSGVLATKLGTKGVAILIGLPLDVVEAGVSALLEDGCLTPHPLGYVAPNFMAAQDTPQSDSHRKRESRERRRSMPGDGNEDNNSVTKRDQKSQNVTKSHERSRAVTRGHEVSLRTSPVRTSPDQKERGSLRLALVPGRPDRKQKAEPGPDHQAAIDGFHQRFKARYGTKPTWSGKEIGQLSALLRRHDLATLLERMDFMFSDQAKWPPGPYSLGVFVGHVDRWIAEPIAQKTYAKMEDIST